MPDRWRGRLDLIYDPFGEHKCEVCFQCAVCPVEAIDMSGFDSQGNRIRYAGDLRRAQGPERLPARRPAGAADAQRGALGRGGRQPWVSVVVEGFGGRPRVAGGHLHRRAGALRLPAGAGAASSATA